MTIKSRISVYQKDRVYLVRKYRLRNFVEAIPEMTRDQSEPRSTPCPILWRSQNGTRVGPGKITTNIACHGADLTNRWSMRPKSNFWISITKLKNIKDMEAAMAIMRYINVHL